MKVSKWTHRGRRWAVTLEKGIHYPGFTWVPAQNAGRFRHLFSLLPLFYWHMVSAWEKNKQISSLDSYVPSTVLRSIHGWQPNTDGVSVLWSHRLAITKKSDKWMKMGHSRKCPKWEMLVEYQGISGEGNLINARRWERQKLNLLGNSGIQESKEIWALGPRKTIPRAALKTTAVRAGGLLALGSASKRTHCRCCFPSTQASNSREEETAWPSLASCSMPRTYSAPARQAGEHPRQGSRGILKSQHCRVVNSFWFSWGLFSFSVESPLSRNPSLSGSICLYFSPWSPLGWRPHEPRPPCLCSSIRATLTAPSSQSHRQQAGG